MNFNNSHHDSNHSNSSSLDYKLILDKMLEVSSLMSDHLKENFLRFKEESVFYKDHGDEIVTKIDIEVQKKTIDFLKKIFPKADFVGEESNEDNKFYADKELIFIIDPIDGTSNYVYGLEQFCFSLGVASFGKIVGGVVISPLTQETFYGIKNVGVFYKHRDEEVATIDEAFHKTILKKHHKYLIGTTYPCINLVYNKLSKKISARIFGSIALTMCYALVGRLDGFLTNTAKIWDIAGVLGIAHNIPNINLFLKYNSEENKYSVAIHREIDQFKILQDLLSSHSNLTF